MTVSNVINGKDFVSEPFRLRVQKAIKKTGYRPDRRGRSLRLSREFAVGFLIVHPDSRFLDDPFITQFAAGLSNGLSSKGYGLLINGALELAEVSRKVDMMAHMDAIVVFTSGVQSDREKVYKQVLKIGLPTLVVQDRYSNPAKDIMAVLQDDFGGAALLAKRLIQKDIKRVLFVEPKHDWYAVRQRKQGILSVLPDNVTLDSLAVDETNHKLMMQEIGSFLKIKGMFDAVMAANDQIGIAAIRAAMTLGLRIPDDLMVTGFNGFDFRFFFSPLIETVISPAYEMGSESATRILHRLEQGNFQDKQLVMPVHIDFGSTVTANSEEGVAK